ncbi:sensor histidine kinase [Nocardioides sp.]|uniref:sensor histidine kinase n=1 Tax=Nocardioides sp. TaxID=35761 RepID=UPI002ED64B9D
MTWFLTGWRRVEPRLRRFALINATSLVSATVLLTAIYLLGPRYTEIRQITVVLLMASVVMVGGLALAPVLGADGVTFALLTSALIFAFGCVWVSPWLSPLAVLVLLVPLIVAYPFLGRRTLTVAVVVVLVSVTATAAMAEQRRMLGEDFPTHVLSLVVSVPVVVVVIMIVVRQNHQELHDRADQLRESRRQVAQVADAARRSLERDLHDGAQQRLVSMSVLISRVRQLIDRGDLVQARLAVDDLGEQNLLAINELRELARGIYPQLLAERGLVAALAAAARRSTVPATVRAEPLERQSQEVESAVYFCILEALQNAAKHSGADQVEIRLHGDPRLEFAVIDTGRGFDPSSVEQDGGLLGMAVRIRAAGGELRVESAPGQGTAVRGSFPGPVDRPSAR